MRQILNKRVPAAVRGTYAGAAPKAPYLASLGVTAVEFLPVQETQNDANDNTPNSTAGQNYWGYMTLNYFAPDRRYASNKAPGGPTSEFQAMVKAFHDQGIKVYIDVVYNHTGEGGAWNANDPTTYTIFSWRGLDTRMGPRDRLAASAAVAVGWTLAHLLQEETLSADRLEQLGEALLDFNSPADLDAWLQSHP